MAPTTYSISRVIPGARSRRLSGPRRRPSATDRMRTARYDARTTVRTNNATLRAVRSPLERRIDAVRRVCERRSAAGDHSTEQVTAAAPIGRTGRGKSGVDVNRQRSVPRRDRSTARTATVRPLHVAMRRPPLRTPGTAAHRPNSRRPIAPVRAPVCEADHAAARRSLHPEDS